MPAHRKWIPEEDATLREAYLRGDTLQQIAEHLDCEIFHVFDRVAALRKQGAELPPRKPRWTDQRRAHLAKRRRQGRTLSQLEAEFEISRGTLTYQLRTLRRLDYDLGDG